MRDRGSMGTVGLMVGHDPMRRMRMRMRMRWGSRGWIDGVEGRRMVGGSWDDEIRGTIYGVDWRGARGRKG